MPCKPAMTAHSPKKQANIVVTLSEFEKCSLNSPVKVRNHRGAQLRHRCEAKRRRDAIHPVIDAVQDDTGPDRSGCPEKDSG